MSKNFKRKEVDNMLVPNQMIKMKWSSSNKKHFVEKGYTYTKMKDSFFVKVEDLCPSSKTLVKVICDYCDKEYSIDYGTYNKYIRTNGKVCCNKCKGIKNSLSNKEKTCTNNMNKARIKCEQLGLSLLSTEDDYINARSKLKVLCPKHGIFNISYSNIIDAKHVCLKCAWDSIGDDKRLSPNKVREILESKNNNIALNPEEYINNSTTNLKILCGKCNKNIFTTSLVAYTKPSCRCICKSCNCIESASEERIRHFLEDNDINFIPQYTFKDCKDKYVLPFDFYLPDYNKIIEFDGEQHYRPAGFGLESHLRTVAHDKIKNEYCEKNNIDLLRIPYWNENDIEDILKKELNIA